jgi:hypothetical protein
LDVQFCIQDSLNVLSGPYLKEMAFIRRQQDYYMKEENKITADKGGVVFQLGADRTYRVTTAVC